MSIPAASPMRAAVVAEARTWLGTPWHHMARVKGGGVDCAQILAAVYHAAGLVPDLDLGYYPPDWHLHQERARFLEALLQHADPLSAGDTPLPGDLAMFRYGRQAAHGSIIIEWPLILHAYLDEGKVTLSDASRGPLARRLAGFYRVRGLQ